jgi:type IV secretory pathway VirB2 component (pilin)
MLYPALVTALAVLGAFIAPLILSYRHAGSRTPDTLSPSGHIAPRVIQNSSIVYRLGWVALAPLLVWGIVGELWPAIVYLVSIGLGLWLFFALRRPILQFLQGAAVHDRSMTVHQFIARCHGNDARVGAFAAALSVFAIYGLIACVMIGLATVLRTIFSGSGALAETFVVVIFLLVAGSTLLAGRSGILYATQIQLGLVYFGLFAATVLLLYLQGSAIGAMPLKGIVALLLIALVCALLHFRRRSRYLDTSIRPNAADTAGEREREPLGVRLLVRLQKILNSLVGILAMTLIVLAIIVAGFEVFLGGVPAIAGETLQGLQAGTSASTMTLISLCLLPLLQPMVDVVNWQRVAVFAKERDGGQYTDVEWTAAFKTFGHTYAREVPLMALFVVLFGVLAGLTLAGASEGDATQAFLASLLAQDNSVATAIVSLLMLGILALAVATIGSLLSAAIAIVGNDIVPILRPRSISTADAAAGEPAGESLTATAAIGVLVSILILATFLLADMRSEHSLGIAGLLGAMLAFSSVQMALVPLTLAPLLSGSGRSANVTPAWAAAVLAVGAAIGVGITIAGLLFGQAAALPFAVPAAFAATTLVFLIAVLASRNNAAAGGGASH